MMLGKGRFLAPFAGEHIFHTALWVLTRDLIYIDSRGEKHVAPLGFTANGLSTPFFLWWLWPPFGGEYDEASGLHDWTYQESDLPRYTCDWLMLDALVSSAMHVGSRAKRYWYILSAVLFFVMLRIFGWYAFWKARRKRLKARAYAMYYAVRMFGGFAWNRKRSGKKSA